MKTITSALCAICMIAIAFVHSSASAQAQTADTISSVYVTICTPIPISFWEKASNQELVRMMETMQTGHEQAFDVLTKRMDEVNARTHGSFPDEWEKILASLLKTDYREEITEYVKELIYHSSGYGIQQRYIHLIAGQLLTDTTFRDAILPAIIEQSNQVMMYDGDKETHVLREIVGIKTFAAYHEDAFTLLKEYGNNSDMIWILKNSSEENKYHQKALATILARPATSGTVYEFITAFPKKAKVMWAKAAKESVCVNEQDMYGILSIGQYNHILPELDSIQQNCFAELKRSEYFTQNPDSLWKLTRVTYDEYSGVEIPMLSKTVTANIIELLKTGTADLLSSNLLFTILEEEGFDFSYAEEGRKYLTTVIDSHDFSDITTGEHFRAVAYEVYNADSWGIEILGVPKTLILDALEKRIMYKEDLRAAQKQLNNDEIQTTPLVCHILAKKEYGQEYYVGNNAYLFREKTYKKMHKAFKKTGSNLFRTLLDMLPSKTT